MERYFSPRPTLLEQLAGSRPGLAISVDQPRNDLVGRPRALHGLPHEEVRIGYRLRHVNHADLLKRRRRLVDFLLRVDHCDSRHDPYVVQQLHVRH